VAPSLTNHETPTTKGRPAMTTQITRVTATQIIAGDNDRTTFNTEAINELAASIKTFGLAQPITVRPLENNTFEIVAGERRFRAMQTLGWTTIPAIVRELDDETASAIMLAENTSRVDLDPVEEAKAYGKRVAQGHTAREVAEAAGVSPFRVQRRLALLNLTTEGQNLVTHGNLTLTNALMVSRLDSDRQHLAIVAIAQTPMTAQEIQSLCHRLADDQEAAELFDLGDVMVVENMVADVKKANTVTRKDLLALVTELAATGGELADKARTLLGQDTDEAAA
jgi:ParB family chromosome partitioning protein